MFENAQIEESKFKEIKCEESIIKVDTKTIISNSRFEDKAIQYLQKYELPKIPCPRVWSFFNIRGRLLQFWNT